MIKIEIDVDELKSFLYFLGDKIDLVYKKETDNAIREFIEDLEEKTRKL